LGAEQGPGAELAPFEDQLALQHALPSCLKFWRRCFIRLLLITIGLILAVEPATYLTRGKDYRNGSVRNREAALLAYWSVGVARSNLNTDVSGAPAELALASRGVASKAVHWPD
jgi:hypothetical protein